MSGSGGQAHARQMSVEAMEEEAASWLLQRHFFDWTPDQQAKLDAWLAASFSHQIVYWRLKAGLARTERLAALRVKKREAFAQASLARRSLLRIAAVVLVVSGMGFGGATYLYRTQEKVFATPVGGHVIETLADGSKIELNTDTIIQARLNGGQRLITLVRGEAFFQVRHDADHPFIVKAGEHRVIDLGTKFLVRKDADRLEVVLLEGRAQFDFGGSHARHTILAPGDKVEADATSMSLKRQTGERAANELGWRTGVLIFHRTTLVDAAAEFNRYNTRKLIIGDTSAAKLQIDGTFPANDPASFADITSDILHLRVEKQRDQTVISR